MLRAWLAIQYQEVFEVSSEAIRELHIRSQFADKFTKWKVALGVVNVFATYASSRTMDQIDSDEATHARKSLEVIAKPGMRELVKGRAAQACAMYDMAPHPLIQPFISECPILIE